ncbi:MAG: UDP-N-acetylglucosamine 2-epimerase (hydrolyzing) [Planctomycetes bacterium]|nr:UDP-N-acetylglucosamine 2-epimerase (hydrolyzing) [Planctomycetota bacterium]
MKKPTQRNITVVTGTRAEYGLLKSIMSAIGGHPRLRLQVVVTGMHLLKKFGLTVAEVERDGWPIQARVPMQNGRDDRLEHAAALARGIEGLAEAFARARTDIVVVLGDRLEALAGALAAVTSGKALAHIHGGDVAPGDFDDAYRHSITKLAHVHLAATRAAARRIVRMGEPPERVHVVGAPGLDRLCELMHEARFESDDRSDSDALIVQHPVGRAAAREQRTMAAILRAVGAEGLTPLVLYPNSDAGHSGIVAAIDSARRRGGIRVLRSMARDEYLRALMAARVLVGNSSSGIIEAAAAGTPAVNVGTRQNGRQTTGRAIVHCGESYVSIRSALSAALRKRVVAGAATPYGDGRAGRRIARILAGVRLSRGLLHKKLAYS